MYDDLIWDSFKRFKFYYKKEQILIGKFEKELLHNFSKESEGNKIYIMPKDSNYILILNVIYNVLYYCFENLYKGDTDILDTIKKGDFVEYYKALSVFQGIEDNYIVLRFKDGTSWIPISLRYKISKYSGQAKMINKMPTNINKGTNKTKGILAEILNIDAYELCKITRKTILIITNKLKVDDIMKNLEIKVGNNERVLLSQVFPMAYYSSECNCYNYKGNSKKEEPIIKFVSKTYIADKIVKKRNNINFILSIPQKLNIEDIEDIVHISKKKVVKKSFIIATPREIEKYMNNEFMNEKFDINTIKFNSINYTSDEINKLNRKQIEYIKNYEIGELRINKIKDLFITKTKKKINNYCNNLLKLFEDDNDILYLIILARKISKQLTSISIPIDLYDKLLKSNYEGIEGVSDLLFKFKNEIIQIKKRNLSEHVIVILNNLGESIEFLYSQIYDNNYKWNNLKSIISSSRYEKVSILIDNKIIREVTKKYLKKIFFNKVNLVFDNLSNNEENNFETIIIPSKLENNLYWNYKMYESNKVINLFYKFEEWNYFYLKRRYENFIANDIDDIKLMDDIETNYMDDDRVKNVNLENEIDELLTINYIPSIINISGHEKRIVECDSILVFTDGRKAFLTPQYLAYVLNENREELIVKKPKELSRGEILIFIEDLDRDIIDLKIQDLMSVDKINELFKEDYTLSKKWKEILKDYIDLNELTYEDLRLKMNLYGIKRTKASIRSWVIDEIVGPKEEDIYYALSKITENEFFIENYKKIYLACNSIRNLQRKVRKSIAKSLLRSSITEDVDEIDKLIIDNFSKDIEYISKVEICNIHEVKKNVPIYITNKIIEG
ncbi:DrmE family protein [Clostridioides sp. ZZV14-6104]|uniref:DrmE family protein n=1 Tax=Clostridioides sp. ZZV14-6104 TaxID=2811491 RepID=UPI001D1125E5|nr:DrmE family protein [Clostridioides sp. ZZV14-6104]